MCPGRVTVGADTVATNIPDEGLRHVQAAGKLFRSETIALLPNIPTLQCLKCAGFEVHLLPSECPQKRKEHFLSALLVDPQGVFLQEVLKIDVAGSIHTAGVTVHREGIRYNPFR